jgi:hypothetical protein
LYGEEADDIYIAKSMPGSIKTADVTKIPLRRICFGCALEYNCHSNMYNVGR